MINKEFNEPNYWSEAWVRHIETYLAAPPRCGIWLRSKFNNLTYTIHECAGGSCRDSRYLHGAGFLSSGSDFDEMTINYVKDRFKSTSFEVSKQNAFNFLYQDDHFDVVFHNGFWICFESDSDIITLLKEQARITKRYLIVLVHNANNPSLIKLFNEKGENDDLYKIRFFDIQTLRNILDRSNIRYKKFRFDKFGGPVDRLYGFERYISFISPLTRWLVPRLYRFQPWSKVERIAMIVELE